MEGPAHAARLKGHVCDPVGIGGPGENDQTANRLIQAVNHPYGPVLGLCVGTQAGARVLGAFSARDGQPTGGLVQNQPQSIFEYQLHSGDLSHCMLPGRGRVIENDPEPTLETA